MRDEIQCPACRATMESETFARARIDVCASGCHGLWFDFGEMTRFLKSGFVRVKRTGPEGRFFPIKTPEDLEVGRDEVEEMYRPREI